MPAHLSARGPAGGVVPIDAGLWMAPMGLDHNVGLLERLQCAAT